MVVKDIALNRPGGTDIDFGYKSGKISRSKETPLFSG